MHFSNRTLAGDLESISKISFGYNYPQLNKNLAAIRKMQMKLTATNLSTSGAQQEGIVHNL